MNISGVLVACRPEHVSSVVGALGTMSWARIHHGDDRGRLVVTIEAVDATESAARVRALQKLPHVLMAEMVEYVTENDQP
jgi:nitrate reductase NapD